MAEMKQSLPCDATDLACLCNAVSFETNSPAYNCVKSQCTVKESLCEYGTVRVHGLLLADNSAAARDIFATTCGHVDRDRGPTYTIVAIVFTTISSLAVIQRFAIKLWFPRLTIGLDDCLTLLTAALQMSGTVVGTTHGVSNGLGRDVWTLSYQQITDFSFALYVYTLIYFASIASLKLSFLFLYLRIFPKKSVKRLLWGTVGLAIVYGLVFIFLGIFPCHPISHYWNRWDGEHVGTCMDVSAIAWANGAVSIAIDLWMMSIPFAQLRKLNLTLKRKLGVFAMFGVGLL